MKKLELDEIKSIELEILDYLDQFCNANGLHYFLDGGTLLGAVRHRGFIPWDDDIDVLMPREDYDKLISLSCEFSGKYALKSYSIDNTYLYPYTKIIRTDTKIIEKEIVYPGYGIFIDVFPMDSLPNNSKSRIKFQKRIWMLTNMADYAVDNKTKRRGIVSNAKKFVSKLIGIKTILRLIDKEASKYRDCDCLYSYDVIASTNINRLVCKKVFEKTVKLEFEGKLYDAPVGYEEYLGELFGDYMQLPPVEKRFSNHSFEAYLITDED